MNKQHNIAISFDLLQYLIMPRLMNNIDTIVDLLMLHFN